MNIYCCGIGGIGLSAYASLQRQRGHNVSGSDKNPSALTESLEKQGITVTFDQSGNGVPEDAEVLVYSEAIPEDAPERKRAFDLKMKQQSYPQALGELSKGSHLIAVCGTHGKSSTTAMAARLLIQAQKDPTVVVGTKMKELEGKNWRVGIQDLFVIEACEYRRSFLSYDPSIILLTNADGDHFDYYASKEDYLKAFVEFVSRLPKSGILITHLSDPDCRYIADQCNAKIVDADTQPLIPLQTPGLHMRQNAQLVLALAAEQGIDAAQAQEIVSGYSGSWRRLEEKGVTASGAVVIDDYAHHPREIAATIAAVKERYVGKRIVVVFQPHTHDRTLALYGDFLSVFSGVDLVLMPNVYDARSHADRAKVDLAAFAKDISNASSVPVEVTGSLDATRKILLAPGFVKHADVVLCMGAGDITALASALV